MKSPISSQISPEQKKAKMANVAEGESMTIDSLFLNFSQLLNETKEEIKREIYAVQQSIQLIDTSVENHDQRIIKLEETVSALENEVKHVKADRNQLEQYTRKYCLEIHGAYSVSSETPLDIALKVFRALGFEFSETEIDACHFLKKQRMGRPVIIVKFISCGRARSVLAARTQLKSLKPTEYGLPEDATRIYINESLTKENAGIFHAARIFAKDNNWAQVWTFQGVTYLRKTKDGKTRRFDSLNVTSI